METYALPSSSETFVTPDVVYGELKVWKNATSRS